MKVLTPGYLYEVANFKNPETPGQQIQFIENKANENGEFTIINNGTTNEEILAMLIDRLTFQSKLLPNRETSIAITHLQDAENWLLRRSRERAARGVEGTNKA